MKIFTKTEYSWNLMEDIITVRYMSKDGIFFNAKEKCLRHEEKITEYIEFYKLCLKSNIYAREKLAEIYDDYESREDEWRRAGGDNWLNYCAAQYALKQVLAG